MRKKKSPYQRAKDALDAVCNMFIKLRDKKKYGGVCPICGKRPIQCWFHFIPRGATAIRWHIWNSCGACNGCNMEERNRRGMPEYMEKLKARHAEMFGPDAWGTLERVEREERIYKRSAAELLEVKKEFEDRMAEGRY